MSNPYIEPSTSCYSPASFAILTKFQNTGLSTRENSTLLEKLGDSLLRDSETTANRSTSTNENGGDGDDGDDSDDGGSMIDMFEQCITNYTESLETKITHNDLPSQARLYNKIGYCLYLIAREKLSSQSNNDNDVDSDLRIRNALETSISNYNAQINLGTTINNLLVSVRGLICKCSSLLILGRIKQCMDTCVVGSDYIAKLKLKETDSVNDNEVMMLESRLTNIQSLCSLISGDNDAALIYSLQDVELSNRIASASTPAESSINSRYNLGLTYITKGDYSDAIRCFVKVCEFCKSENEDPNYILTSSKYHLALCYYYNRDYEFIQSIVDDGIRFCEGSISKGESDGDNIVTPLTPLLIDSDAFEIDIKTIRTDSKYAFNTPQGAFLHSSLLQLKGLSLLHLNHTSHLSASSSASANTSDKDQSNVIIPPPITGIARILKEALRITNDEHLLRVRPLFQVGLYDSLSLLHSLQGHQSKGSQAIEYVFKARRIVDESCNLKEYVMNEGESRLSVLHLQENDDVGDKVEKALKKKSKKSRARPISSQDNSRPSSASNSNSNSPRRPNSGLPPIQTETITPALTKNNNNHKNKNSKKQEKASKSSQTLSKVFNNVQTLLPNISTLKTNATHNSCIVKRNGVGMGNVFSSSSNGDLSKELLRELVDVIKKNQDNLTLSSGSSSASAKGQLSLGVTLCMLGNNKINAVDALKASLPASINEEDWMQEYTATRALSDIYLDSGEYANCVKCLKRVRVLLEVQSQLQSLSKNKNKNDSSTVCLLLNDAYKKLIKVYSRITKDLNERDMESRVPFDEYKMLSDPEIERREEDDAGFLKGNAVYRIVFFTGKLKGERRGSSWGWFRINSDSDEGGGEKVIDYDDEERRYLESLTTGIEAGGGAVLIV